MGVTNTFTRRGNFRLQAHRHPTIADACSVNIVGCNIGGFAYDPLDPYVVDLLRQLELGVLMTPGYARQEPVRAGNAPVATHYSVSYKNGEHFATATTQQQLCRDIIARVGPFYAQLLQVNPGVEPRKPVAPVDGVASPTALQFYAAGQGAVLQHNANLAAAANISNGGNVPDRRRRRAWTPDEETLLLRALGRQKWNVTARGSLQLNWDGITIGERNPNTFTDHTRVMYVHLVHVVC